MTPTTTSARSSRHPDRDAFRQFQYLTSPLGTSASGFRAEVEAEQALARGEQLLELTTDHMHELTGPAAGEAAHRLTAFVEQPAAAGFAGAVITDPARLRRILARHDPHVHPGPYITCVFNPDRALCQPRPDPGGQLRPAPPRCQPLECRNVALTPSNRTALEAEAARLDGELTARPLLPPLLAEQLARRQDAVAAFLTRHTLEHAP